VSPDSAAKLPFADHGALLRAGSDAVDLAALTFAYKQQPGINSERTGTSCEKLPPRKPDRRFGVQKARAPLFSAPTVTEPNPTTVTVLPLLK
jgi:hypothetical protein